MDSSQLQRAGILICLFLWSHSFAQDTSGYGGNESHTWSRQSNSMFYINNGDVSLRHDSYEDYIPDNRYLGNSRNERFKHNARKKGSHHAVKKLHRNRKIRKSANNTTHRYYRYKVKKGDTLTKIARKHNTSVPNIIKKNRLKNKNTIYAGMVLMLPDYRKNKIRKNEKKSSHQQKA